MGSEKGKISVLEARTPKSGDGSREEGSYRLGNGQENGGEMDEQGLLLGKRARGVLQRPVGFAGTRGDVGKDLLAASLPSLPRGCHNFMAINKNLQLCVLW